MTRIVPRIHAVTRSDILDRADFVRQAAMVAAIPDVAIHLRDRTRSGAGLIALAEQIVSRAPGAVILCNDRADVAAASPAFAGVHLPEAGLPVAATRAWLGPEPLIGRSGHSPADVDAALHNGADFVFLGPAYPTASHPDTPALGPDVFNGLRGRPVIAIGGVTEERVRACRDAGAWGVAAITAIWDASVPASVVEAMRVLLG